MGLKNKICTCSSALSHSHKLTISKASIFRGRALAARDAPSTREHEDRAAVFSEIKNGSPTALFTDDQRVRLLVRGDKPGHRGALPAERAREERHERGAAVRSRVRLRGRVRRGPARRALRLS